MKVLMVDQFLPQSVYTLELCRELKKYEQITIFCKKNGSANLEGVCWKDKLYAGGKKKLPAIWEYVRGLISLKKEIRYGKYDIVHVQSFKDAKYEIPLYCREKRYMGFLVHTVHNLLPHETAAGDLKLYSDFYQCCDLLIVHNAYCQQLLINEYGIEEAKIRIMPHGSYTQIKKISREYSKTGRKKIQFLQFGILRPYKGIDILLEAISKIPDAERAKFHVTIAGAQHPKMDATDYENMIRKLGVENSVTLIRRHILDEELDELYQKTDFCLFPYRNIYGSGALLMAYSYEKPVIASNIPAFREETQNGKTGLLVEPENSEAFSRAILQAIQIPEQKYIEYQQEIHKAVNEKYNWKNSAKILSEAYRER